jgi:hypothetical protein
MLGFFLGCNCYRSKYPIYSTRACHFNQSWRRKYFVFENPNKLKSENFQLWGRLSDTHSCQQLWAVRMVNLPLFFNQLLQLTFACMLYLMNVIKNCVFERVGSLD